MTVGHSNADPSQGLRAEGMLLWQGKVTRGLWITSILVAFFPCAIICPSHCIPTAGYEHTRPLVLPHWGSSFIGDAYLHRLTRNRNIRENVNFLICVCQWCCMVCLSSSGKRSTTEHWNALAKALSVSNVKLTDVPCKTLLTWAPVKPECLAKSAWLHCLSPSFCATICGMSTVSLFYNTLLTCM